MIVTSFQELKFFIQNKTICPVTTAMYKIRFKDIVYLKLNKSWAKIYVYKKTINKNNSKQ